MTDADRVARDEVFKLNDLSFITDMPHIVEVIFIGKRFGLRLSQVQSEGGKRDYKRVVKRFEDHFDIKIDSRTLITSEENEELEVRYKALKETLNQD